MLDPAAKAGQKCAPSSGSGGRAAAVRRILVPCVAALCLLSGCRGFGPFRGAAWRPPAGHLTFPIWPQRPPGSSFFSLPETNRTTAQDELVAGRPVVRLYHVATPTLTLYSPKGNNSGAAVLVLPGGGFYMLAVDIEGTEVCGWLVSRGINCALLKYRVPHAGPYPYHDAGLQDAQRAMGMLRARAAEWHIDPSRIGVLGFSAAGQLAAALSTHFDHRAYTPVDAADEVSCRPAFAVLVYPGYLLDPKTGSGPNRDLEPHSDTPPMLLIQAEDDPIRVENAVTYFLTLRQARVPAEMHIYASGGHGYGMRATGAPANAWPEAMMLWLRTVHVLR